MKNIVKYRFLSIVIGIIYLGLVGLSILGSYELNVNFGVRYIILFLLLITLTGFAEAFLGRMSKVLLDKEVEFFFLDKALGYTFAFLNI